MTVTTIITKNRILVKSFELLFSESIDYIDQGPQMGSFSDTFRLFVYKWLLRYRRRRCCFSRPSFPFFVVSRSSQFSTNTVVSAEKALARVSEKKMLQITSSSLSSSTPIPTSITSASSDAFSSSDILSFSVPTPTTRNNNANRDDATTDGGYDSYGSWVEGN